MPRADVPHTIAVSCRVLRCCVDDERLSNKLWCASCSVPVTSADQPRLCISVLSRMVHLPCDKRTSPQYTEGIVKDCGQRPGEVQGAPSEPP